MICGLEGQKEDGRLYGIFEMLHAGRVELCGLQFLRWSNNTVELGIEVSERRLRWSVLSS